jgi:predicted RNA-binding protein with PIN domain
MAVPDAATVLIDGYNVIMRQTAWTRLSMADARRRLVSLVARARWPMPIQRVLVIFDAQEDATSAGGRVTRAAPPPFTRHPGAPDGIAVRFATPSADEEILHRIRTSAVPDRLLVISDDGQLIRTAKSYGVRRCSVAWLLARSQPARPPPAAQAPWPQPDDGRAALPAATARQITEELSARWLRRSV